MFSTQDVIFAVLVGLAVGCVIGMTFMSLTVVGPLERRLRRERSRRLRRTIAAATRSPW